MPSNLPNVTALFSGRGSNLRSLIVHATSYRINQIVTDNPSAGGLTLAAEYGIKATVVNPTECPSRAEFKRRVFETVKDSAAQFVCLAGYMQIVQAEFVEHFYGRLLNIHPSLLPALPGLHTHERALKAGLKRHGCTVHFVDQGVDTGPIIAQMEVSVEPSDSVESLSNRVLAKEHLLYPWVANRFASGEIFISNNQVKFSDTAVQDANSLGITLGS